MDEKVENPGYLEDPWKALLVGAGRPMVIAFRPRHRVTWTGLPETAELSSAIFRISLLPCANYCVSAACMKKVSRPGESNSWQGEGRGFEGFA